MFGKGIKLFRFFGFTVRMDWSWLIIFFLVTWSLAVGYLPWNFPDFPQSTYWILGFAGAIVLFLSLIFHELSHSIVARRYGMKISGITLFVFGGVASMEEEPSSPDVELRMSAAGPAASVLAGLFLYGVAEIGVLQGWSSPVTGIIRQVGYINFILAGFNLLPGFPLDGGRILRSILWKWKKNLRWATSVASQVGSGIGFALILLGIFSVLVGGFIAGLWWFLIGMFLRSAASGSYKQTVLKEILQNEKVEKFMNRNPVSVPPSISVEELINEYVYKYHYKFFPVSGNGRVSGCVGIDGIKGMTHDQRRNLNVMDVADECSADNSIRPDVEVLDAISTMRKTGKSRLMVIDDEKNLVGIISLKDLLGYISLKMELEEARD